MESAFKTPVIQTDKSVRLTCPNKHLPVQIIADTTTNIEIKVNAKQMFLKQNCVLTKWLTMILHILLTIDV